MAPLAPCKAAQEAKRLAEQGVPGQAQSVVARVSQAQDRLVLQERWEEREVLAVKRALARVEAVARRHASARLGSVAMGAISNRARIRSGSEFFRWIVRSPLRAWSPTIAT